MTTRLPPIGRAAGAATEFEDSTADLGTFKVAGQDFDDDDDYMYDVESFCSESLSSVCSDESDVEFVESIEGSMVSSSDRRRETELNQLDDFARWAKRFGGGAKGLSVASFLQEWRDLRRVGGDDPRSDEVR